MFIGIRINRIQQDSGLRIQYCLLVLFEYYAVADVTGRAGVTDWSELLTRVAAVDTKSQSGTGHRGRRRA